MHLVRHYLLFVFVVVFLLTLARAAYNLWQFDKVVEANVLIPSFLQGLRFDLALIGMVLVDDPQNEGKRHGGSVAAPIFKEIAEAGMYHFGVRRLASANGEMAN